jgi:hypothetical protein
VPGLALAFLLASFFPRVENPWPETIGLGLPVALAGAGGVLATVLFADTSQSRRDRQVRRFGLLGFYLGVASYFISLVIQVGFN